MVNLGKEKNLVNFSCTSRQRGSGMLHSFERRFDLKCLVKNGFPQKHSKKSEIGTHKRAKRAERGITPAFSRGLYVRIQMQGLVAQGARSPDFAKCNASNGYALQFCVARREFGMRQTVTKELLFLGNWSWDWLLA